MALPVIPLDILLPLTLAQVSSTVLAWPRVRVGSLTLDDWASRPDYPNGVYLFFPPDSHAPPFYIGRASSRSFLGRIPSHFEPRESFWMNGLSKAIKSHNHASTYLGAVQVALSYHLVLIGATYPEDKTFLMQRKQRINSLELVLQAYMQATATPRRQACVGSTVLQTLI